MKAPKERTHALESALDAARWAPSVHNTQPWSFSLSGGEIGLRADTERTLAVSDSEGRELLISCGAALFTMCTTLRCEGYEPIVTILPDPDRPSLLATVKAGNETKADEETWVLGGEIERRRTHRAGFASPKVPGRLIDSLIRAAREEGAKLTVVDLPAAVEVIAALTRAAQGVQAQDRRFTLEMIRWSRRPGSSRRDGVPAEAYPGQALPTHPEFAQRDYAWQQGWGHDADQSGSATTGVVALLTTPGDSRQEWIAAGQALQHILLRAAAHGVSAAFHTQALEMYHLREFLRLELCSGEYPQMIMRLGVTFDETESVRRPVTDLMD
ncbi:Acg family FMN-binding oxidoreductase [Nonomuraea sp. NPDC051941]|uniref:Acg family FMN-binding oxidoreductase n=1 Tax=Nonomuraea sp. NPDC051941 TaxID=3364373 RepID=UPI0037C63DBA